MNYLSFLQDINALGTLILAIIAVIAILVPIGITRYRRPKFSILLYATKFETGLNEYPEVMMSFTNVGRYPAHSCKVMAAIEDDKGKKLGRYYLPWVSQNPDEYKPKGLDQETPIKYNDYKDVTYAPIDIFPHESIITKFLFWLDVIYGSPETAIWAVFGASRSYYYFPRYNDGELQTVPPISEYSPYFYIPEEFAPTYLKNDITYCVKITVYSEEHTYLELKKFFFKLGDNGISAGDTKECADVRTWS